MRVLTFAVAVLLSQGIVRNHSLAGAQSSSQSKTHSVSQLGTLPLQIESVRSRPDNRGEAFSQNSRGLNLLEKAIETAAIRQHLGDAQLPLDVVDSIPRKKQVHIHKPRAIKELEARAQTKEDFENLATLWENEATRYIRLAMEHKQEADDYATRRRFEPKTGIPGGLLAHCRQLFELDRQRTRSASAAALVNHEKAEAIGGKSLVLDLASEPEVSCV
jgi:hypothetical protein